MPNFCSPHAMSIYKGKQFPSSPFICFDKSKLIFKPLIRIFITHLNTIRVNSPKKISSGFSKANFKCALLSDCWRCHWNYIDSTSATWTLYHSENTGNDFYGNGSHSNRLSSYGCTSGRSASDCQWGWKSVTGYYLSEGLILESIKPKWFFVDMQDQCTVRKLQI